MNSSAPPLSLLPRKSRYRWIWHGFMLLVGAGVLLWPFLDSAGFPPMWEQFTVFLIWWAVMTWIWWVGALQVAAWTPEWMRAKVREAPERVIITSRLGALPLQGAALLVLAFGVYGAWDLVENGFSWGAFLVVPCFLLVGCWGLAGLGGMRVILRQGELQKETGLLLRRRVRLDSGVEVTVGSLRAWEQLQLRQRGRLPLSILSLELAGVNLEVLAQLIRAAQTDGPGGAG